MSIRKGVKSLAKKGLEAIYIKHSYGKWIRVCPTIVLQKIQPFRSLSWINHLSSSNPRVDDYPYEILNLLENSQHWQWTWTYSPEDIHPETCVSQLWKSTGWIRSSLMSLCFWSILLGLACNEDRSFRKLHGGHAC